MAYVGHLTRQLSVASGTHEVQTLLVSECSWHRGVLECLCRGILAVLSSLLMMMTLSVCGTAQMGFSDIIQPGLIQLQPSFDEFMDTLPSLNGIICHIINHHHHHHSCHQHHRVTWNTAISRVPHASWKSWIFSWKLEDLKGPGKFWKNIFESNAFFYWFKWKIYTICK